MVPGRRPRSVRPTARCSSSTSAASSASSTTSRRSRTSCWRAWPARSASSIGSTTVELPAPLPDDWPDPARHAALPRRPPARPGASTTRRAVRPGPEPGRFRRPRPSGRIANGFASSADRCSSNVSRARRFGTPPQRRRSPRSPAAFSPTCAARSASSRSGLLGRRRHATVPRPRRTDPNSTGWPRRSSASGTCSASDRSTRSSPRCPHAEATVGRLWPEHFDYGIDLAAAPGVRCNLGAAGGDGFHAEPYLYVGPLRDPERPGATDYWNAPFGAVLGFGDIDAADDPIRTADRVHDDRNLPAPFRVVSPLEIRPSWK